MKKVGDQNVMQQAADLLEEGTELKSLLDTLTTDDWARETPFKNWTVNQVVQHLHGTDKMAALSVKDKHAFMAVIANPRQAREIRNPPLEGDELKDAWWSYLTELCALLGASDPKRRVPWGGPDMGIMMFTTARQMETWAHGQDIYDLLKVPRVNSDRIRNIAVIGVRTYGWTFANRQMEPPGPPPYVKLTAPSGATWEFNQPAEEGNPTDNYIEGSAVEFCHVVTQGRNIGDKDIHLTVVGEPAEKWMAIAQCFAGPPEEPPVVGVRVSKT